MGKSYGEIFHEMVTMPNVQWPEVWQAILETLYMTVVSTLFAFVFGLILGYYSFYLRKVTHWLLRFSTRLCHSLLIYLEQFHLSY